MSKGAAARYRLECISLTTADIDALAGFYGEALDARILRRERLQGAGFEALMQLRGAAQRTVLAIGEQRLELLQFDTPGDPYPAARQSSDLIFQHFALVVADMERAYRQLSSVAGWSAISTDGPVTLPASSGGVSAFKFRDPEGHPLELLGFPSSGGPALWQAKLRDAAGEGSAILGIDHSAICVTDSARSVDFYETLGFRATARTLNRGPEQARLDGLPAPVAEVTALEPASTPPHFELLCYRGVTRAASRPLRNNDVAATRTVLARGGQPAEAQAVRDPDGHRLLLL